jgi:hypothetical protein
VVIGREKKVYLVGWWGKLALRTNPNLAGHVYKDISEPIVHEGSQREVV